MFQCGLCGKKTAAGERSREVILERRERRYPHRNKANRRVLWSLDKGAWKRRVVWTDDPGGVGWETAKAVRACEMCARCFEESRGENSKML